MSGVLGAGGVDPDVVARPRGAMASSVTLTTKASRPNIARPAHSRGAGHTREARGPGCGMAATSIAGATRAAGRAARFRVRLRSAASTRPGIPSRNGNTGSSRMAFPGAASSPAASRRGQSGCHERAPSPRRADVLVRGLRPRHRHHRVVILSPMPYSGGAFVDYRGARGASRCGTAGGSERHSPMITGHATASCGPRGVAASCSAQWSDTGSEQARMRRSVGQDELHRAHGAGVRRTR